MRAAPAAPSPAPRAPQALVSKGLVRAIGVSNFGTRKMQALIDATGGGAPLSVCQVECHPYWRQDAVRQFCADRGIHLTAFSPLVRQAHGAAGDGRPPCEPRGELPAASSFGRPTSRPTTCPSTVPVRFCRGRPTARPSSKAAQGRRCWRTRWWPPSLASTA